MSHLQWAYTQNMFSTRHIYQDIDFQAYLLVVHWLQEGDMDNMVKFTDTDICLDLSVLLLVALQSTEKLISGKKCLFLAYPELSAWQIMVLHIMCAKLQYTVSVDQY